MDALRQEHSILRLAEGIAKGNRAVTLDVMDAQLVLDRVKNLELALADVLRSGYERHSLSTSEPKAS